MRKLCYLLLLGFIVLFYQPVFAESVFPEDKWVQVESAESVGWSTEKFKRLSDFAEANGTLGLMIIQDGKVVYSYGKIEERTYMASVRKSLISGLIGIYVEEGKINMESTLESLDIDDSAPSLTPQEKQARVIDLLKARSGIYHEPAAETEKMNAARPPRGSHAPGTYWYYNNWDFDTLGVIFENQTKLSIGKAFFERIAKPIGMQQFSSSDVDYNKSSKSIHPAYRFKMSTQDLARYGLLYLNNGTWRGKQIIPQQWIVDSTTSYSTISPGFGYGYMWWLPSNFIYGQPINGTAWWAQGLSGQHLIIIPSMNLVIAHLAPYDVTRVHTGLMSKNLLHLIFDARVK